VPEILPMSTKHCTVERDGHVVTLTMNRPEAKNALSPDMLVGLAQGFDYVDEQDDVRVAILTGAGGCFSSGADLKAMSKPSEDERVRQAMADAPGLHWKALLRDHRLTKPLIAAVEGYALAGGMEIVLACDLVVASTSARFGLPEVARGILPTCGGLFRSARALPLNIAKELLLTGDQLSPQRAYELGLVNRLTDPGHALTEALALAERDG